MPYKAITQRIEELFSDVPSTFLSSDVAAASNTLTVDSIRDIAIDNILFIGEPGDEQSEIIKTHAGTAPSGSTVTLAANTVFAHGKSTKIYVLDYDQVEFSHADTVAGAKSVLATENIDADRIATVYKDSSETSGYYFTRFKNSISSVFSEYSDALPYSGWAENQAGSAIEYALKRNKLNTFSENITKKWCIEETNSGLLEFHNKLKHWHNLQEFDYDLGNVSRGVYAFALPSNVWQYSHKAILQVRVGSGSALHYRDEKEWDALLKGVNHTTAAQDAAIGATSLYVTDARDIPDGGTVMVSGVSITYTDKDNTTGELSGIPASGDGSITAAITTGDDVWEGPWADGDPLYFTVKEGYLYIWPLIDADLDGQNIWLDYWKDTPTIDSEADTLDFKRYDAVKFWLTWAIRCQIKHDGERKIDDGDYILFQSTVAQAVSLELRLQGQKYKSKPHLNKISM